MAFICLKGQTVIPQKNTSFEEKNIASPFQCPLHKNCFAIYCQWPILELEKNWKEKKIDGLIYDATHCFLCQKKASYLCIYGGHMVCEDHSINAPQKKCKTKYPLHCKICNFSPLWPNPFLYMHFEGVLLKPGETQNGFSFSGASVSGQTGFSLSVKSWQYWNDQNPQIMQIDAYYPKMAIVSWRVALFSLTKSPSLSLQRCKSVWVSASPISTLTMIKEKHAHDILSHPDCFFMVGKKVEKNVIFCLVCEKEFPTLDNLLQSLCNPFPNLTWPMPMQ